ncbi:MAG TPA: amidohydrolase family protein [Acidobacteriota bacterium]|nr:amidohydrolase family protein [Acidobacteriota bacterium]
MMTKTALRRTVWFLGIASLSFGPLEAQVAVKAKRLYTMAGPAVEDGILLAENGKISAVGRASEVAIPEGWDVVEATVVTPGLIDARSVVGLSGILNQRDDQEQVDPAEAIQPELRALDAYNPRDPLVAWIRSFGVTTVQTGHAPAKLVAGQAMIVKTVGDTVEDALVVPTSAVVGALGDAARERGKSPGTRAKMAAMLRKTLLDAQSYREKAAKASDDKPVQRDLRKDVWVQVLEGKLPLMVRADRAHDILTALRIAKEFGLRLILDGGAEAYLVEDQIREAGIPIILHATMQPAYGERENLSMATAARLQEAGIPFALQSGYETYVPKTRVVLFEAAVAAKYGLPPEEALAACTVNAARILGVEDRVGSLEVGKDADFVLFDGDPFEYTTHVLGVYVEGRRVSDGDSEWR